MPNITRVTGVKQVINKLRAQDRAWDRSIAVGLKKAGLFLQRKSQLQVPVDYGNLKASAFTRATGTGYGTKVTVGYTAAYALSVHEKTAMKLKGRPRPNDRGKYWDPQGRAKAKFLEGPMREEADTIRAIVIEEVVKGKLR